MLKSLTLLIFTFSFFAVGLAESLRQANISSNNDDKITDVNKCIAPTVNITCGIHGQCNFENTECICESGYATRNLQKQCTYKQKKQLNAFLIHLFIGFTGSGCFYLGQFTIASIELVMFFIAIYLFCTTAGIDGDFKCHNLQITICIVTGSFIYWIVILIIIGTGILKDGNGIPMEPW